MHTLKKGRFFLLTGLSGAGKSTLGRLLVAHLNRHGVRPAYLLDGDAARSFFRDELSFSQEDRHSMTMRMAFAALTLVENNIDVVMANIAAARATREELRKTFSDSIEIYLKVDVDTLLRHDVKGVYTEGMRSTRPMLVGIDLPYEEPESPDVVVFPYSESPEESLRRISEFLVRRGPLIGTKADTLSSLAPAVRSARILPQVVLTWSLIRRDPSTYAMRISDALGAGPYAVRSSCGNEDSQLRSNAGAFSSVLNVPADTAALIDAARKVRDSYAAKGVEDPDNEQILIQAMLTGVRMAGVVCTRHRVSDSPYYVVNYDDAGVGTDVVTGGRGGNVAYLSRFVGYDALGRWERLVVAVRELEELYPRFPLEVEFAIASDGEIVILQCRPLVISSPQASLEESAAELIQDLKLRFERCQIPQPHLPGRRTVLSDMADWNPSEMIGDRPSTLSYSLYRELVLDRTWHEARASQGYFDVVDGHLMLSMARKPYIDTRLSFASLTPATISQATRTRLVDLCSDFLAAHRHLHDKVEFEVLFTCFDLSVEERIRDRGGLTHSEVRELVDSLRALTNSLVLGFDRDVSEDFRHLDLLDRQLNLVATDFADRRQYWECFAAASLLLEHTRRFGVLPFARLARLAFIARSLLHSLQDRGLVSETSMAAFMSSVPTVATSFAEDLGRLRDGAIERDELMRRYGHLRMNTYDVTSPRYDQMPPEVWMTVAAASAERARGSGPKATTIDRPAIDAALADAGLAFGATHLFRFLTTATQAREESKLRFTRALSDLLELLARGAGQLGLTREEIANTTIPVLMRFRNPELGSLAKASHYLRQRIGEKMRERSVFDLIKLPPVIAEPIDIELVELSAAKPNFVSAKCVTAPLARLSTYVDPAAADLAGKIVLIANADPGFDWIFSYPIAGLITKYGGVASHMAIRCAEFDLPGAIGCGELIFSRLEVASSVRLDCKAEVIHEL